LVNAEGMSVPLAIGKMMMNEKEIREVNQGAAI
jgi:predicted ribosome-associated RNA-binding protein Tma20